MLADRIYQLWIELLSKVTAQDKEKMLQQLRTVMNYAGLLKDDRFRML
jgi:hypothetical protein